MNIARIKYNDIADGLGVRTTVFVSGCRRHCKGCHNPETWDFGYGRLFSFALQDEIIASLRPPWVQGLTVCGGEPFEPENEETLGAFLRRVKTELPCKDIWIYSGFTLEDFDVDKELKQPVFANPHSGFYEAKTSRTLDQSGGHAVCSNQGGICVVAPDPAYALQGSMIGRADRNGPQGDGINEDVSFTLNTVDKHAVAQPT